MITLWPVDSMAPASCTFGWPGINATTPAGASMVSITVWLVHVPPTRNHVGVGRLACFADPALGIFAGRVAAVSGERRVVGPRETV